MMSETRRAVILVLRILIAREEVRLPERKKGSGTHKQDMVDQQ